MAMERADLVIGSRRVHGGHVVGWGIHRQLMSWTAQTVARLVLGFRTRDVTSGFRVWRAVALRNVLDGARAGDAESDGHRTAARRSPSSTVGVRSGRTRERVASGYAFQEEMLYRAEAANLHIVEHPITFRDRERGKSKLGLRDIIGFFRTLWRLWIGTNDRRFALWLGLTLVILTGFPYLYGWWNTPAGYTYTGMHALAPGDMAVYGSYLEQAREGHLLFLDLFTSEYPQRPRLDIFWLAAGLFTRVTHLPAPLAFHLIRLLLIIPFTLFLSTFVTAFLRSPLAGWTARTIRRVTLLLLAFASGVGSVIVPSLDGKDLWRPGYNGWPIDFWVPESNTFLTLYQSPHLIASLWLILYIVLCTLRASEWSTSAHPRTLWKWSIGAGLAALALFQFHPFYVPTIFAVLMGWILIESLTSRRIRWDCIIHGAIVAALCAPSIAYHLWLVAVDPIMAAKAEQNLLFTPAWWYVVAGYGFLVPLAIVGMRQLLPYFAKASRDGAQARLLLAWLTVTVILIFSPLTWQRRLTEGLHVVLTITAVFGLFPLLAWLKLRLPARVLRIGWTPATAAAIAVPLLGLSTIANMGRDIALFTIAFPATIPRYSLYYPDTAVDAMRWIRAHANPGDVTFTVGIDGNFLPMYATTQSALGHGVETTDFVEKYHDAYALTGGTLTGSDARAFLERVRARYVLVTDASRDLWQIDPMTLSGVTLAYRNDGAEVYEITERIP
ncbi:MAG: hypothetical protein Q7S02_03400 [bacterium]|nr:hypothetical protein [bacterium]